MPPPVPPYTDRGYHHRASSKKGVVIMPPWHLAQKIGNAFYKWRRPLLHRLYRGEAEGDTRANVRTNRRRRRGLPVLCIPHKGAEHRPPHTRPKNFMLKARMLKAKVNSEAKMVCVYVYGQLRDKRVSKSRKKAYGGADHGNYLFF